MNVKKIIAREGLIFIIFLFGIICLVLERYYVNLFQNSSDLIHAGLQTPEVINTRHNYLINAARFHQIGFWSLVSYAGYLLISFIIWAIKTLRGK